MPFIIDYLLKVSIALAVVYLFYQLLLRRLTFYNWNRWYLTGYGVLCFFIPFMNITDFLFRHELQQNNFVQIIPAFQQLQIIKQPENFWNTQTVLLTVFCTGVLAMGVRVLLQLLSLKRMKTKAILLNTGEVKLYHVNESIVPFSFHDAIYLNKELHTEAELQEIIRHEFVHVKQKHSVDILLAELLCIVLWFNPVAWLLRKAIRQNLEFIADHKVLEEGLDKKQYQYLLLKVVGNNRYSIAPKFNFSSLKNRIIMMNQIKSARVQALRFLFVLPLIAVLLLAFREVRQQENRQGYFQSAALLKDTVPADQIEQVNINKINGRQTVSIVLKNGVSETYNLNDAKEKAAFEKKYGKLENLAPAPPPPPAVMKANEEIVTVDVSKTEGKNIVRIRLKNSKVETYNVDDPKQKEMLEKKYGTSIVAPPPPPPPPVESLAVISPVKEQLTPNEKGYYISIADNHGECVVIVKDRAKKIVEALTLTDWNKKEAVYKTKYGNIPPPPPPVLAPPVPATVTVAPVAKVTGVKSNVAVVSEVNSLSPVSVTGQVSPVSVPSKLTVATSPSPAALVESKGKTISVTTANTENALYYIDGKEATIDEVNKLNPDFIESVNVIKGEDAVKAYGEKGKNGVILIKTKIKTALNSGRNYDDIMENEPE